MDSSKQPLLSQHLQPSNTSSSSSSSFNADKLGDIKPISTGRHFLREFCAESKRQWYLAGPAIVVSFCRFALNAVTVAFAGHLGTIELAAVSVVLSVVAGFAFGIMAGLGSALETLCGQAFGVGQLEMLGIYLQRSWVILNAMGLVLMLLYVFATPILIFIGQTPEISKAAGKFSIWMIPQLFAMAVNFPLGKFLQAQSKMVAMAVILGGTLVLHTFFSWLLLMKLEMGLAGAAIVLNLSWWFLAVVQLLYILSGACGHTWSGFSWKAFQNLGKYVKLSLQSAVMVCLDSWYILMLVLVAGYLKDAEISVDTMSICINIFGGASLVGVGFNTAISIRVSNELGAARPRTANFSVLVGSIHSSFFGLVIALALMITRHQYPVLFSDSAQVKQLVYELTPLLGISIVIGSFQLTLCGVAIGAGWQAHIAYVNLGCYYLFGIPLGLVLGYIFDMSVTGIWYGMLSGLCVQTFFLLGMIYRTNWNKEAIIAGDRIKEWGGKLGAKENDGESYFHGDDGVQSTKTEAIYAKQ
ncbi:protein DETOXIFICATION 30-like [Actinidia eriantha]|uniref:protein DETOXIFICATION 30-like n=1 Tax=Actinidia eriantha TaxID=165200 RepID=UPI002586BE2A|nr:protein DETOXIFICATION 30-like [Actinidia eriantha]